MKDEVVPGPFILVMALVFGCFVEVLPFRWHVSEWLCRSALIILVVKVVVDRLVIGNEEVANERIQNNRCLHCGYDCRATLFRCPECGEDIRQQLDEYVPDHLIDSDTPADTIEQR